VVTRFLAPTLAAGILAVAHAGTVPANFTESVVATGLQSPSGMDFASDGRLFVGDQKGRVWLVRNDTLQTTPVLNIQAKTDYNVERGFQALMLDPDFATNGYLYVFYTALLPASHNRVSRFTVTNNVADTTETVIFTFPNLPSRGSFGCQNIDCNGSTSGTGNTTLAVWHMGGGMVFGNDGKLYVGSGDHEVTSNGQSMSTLFGKIIRINKDGSIPTDNPFYNSASGNNRAIYAIGMRNPYILSVQRSTGRIYMNDVGDATWEEVDTLTAGGNYGWGTCEGRYNTGSTSTLCTIGAAVAPIHSYRHASGTQTTSVGQSVIGGDFTNNFRAQDNGKYFFGDFTNVATTGSNPNNGWIKSINPVTGGDTTVFAYGYSNITGLRFNPSGSALYILSRGYNTGVIDTIGTASKIGRVYKISYNLATSVQPARSIAQARTHGALVMVGAGTTLKVPAHATSVRLFTLSGATVWESRGLTPGAALSLPSHLSNGLLQAIWK
jgi:glucose/arabinose dehydrogenase